MLNRCDDIVIDAIGCCLDCSKTNTTHSRWSFFSRKLLFALKLFSVYDTHLLKAKPDSLQICGENFASCLLYSYLLPLFLYNRQYEDIRNKALTFTVTSTVSRVQPHSESSGHSYKYVPARGYLLYVFTYSPTPPGIRDLTTEDISDVCNSFRF